MHAAPSKATLHAIKTIKATKSPYGSLAPIAMNVAALVGKYWITS
jgi:hypothetical protein